MERQIAIVGADGQFALPARMQKALGIHPGSQLELTLEDSHIVLQPVPPANAIASLPQELLALRGMFSPGTSLEDELKEWRRNW
jgi:AbrB family looped-hinge helix DNA binding protein